MDKSEFLVQGKSAFVRSDNSIELQNAEPAFLPLGQGMAHEHLPDVVPTPFPGDGIAGVANMTASPDIVRMQDIKADDLPGFFVLSQSGKRLR